VLASTETKVATLAKDLAGPPPAPAADPSVPAFDLARIEAGGDAVIAGRAAPGATVDLMRNGERLDRAVADSSGQFVMVPPRLPAGSYELTLSAKLADGTLAQSKQGVTVTIREADATGSLAPSPAPTAAAQIASRAPASVSTPVKPHEGRGPRVQPRQALASTSPSHEGAAPEAGPRAFSSGSGTMRIVSRGDSLWRISRLTYGAGEEYALLYKANRDKIRDPNLILPGQVLILPSR
jgi:nucleoid-associated protein YgaU